MFKTVVAILIAQWIIYIVSKFSGKTLSTIAALKAVSEEEKVDAKTGNLDAPNSKLLSKLYVISAKRKAGII